MAAATLSGCGRMAVVIERPDIYFVDTGKIGDCTAHALAGIPRGLVELFTGIRTGDPVEQANFRRDCTSYNYYTGQRGDSSVVIDCGRNDIAIDIKGRTDNGHGWTYELNINSPRGSGRFNASLRTGERNASFQMVGVCASNGYCRVDDYKASVVYGGRQGELSDMKQAVVTAIDMGKRFCAGNPHGRHVLKLNM